MWDDDCALTEEKKSPFLLFRARQRKEESNVTTGRKEREGSPPQLWQKDLTLVFSLFSTFSRSRRMHNKLCISSATPLPGKLLFPPPPPPLKPKLAPSISDQPLLLSSDAAKPKKEEEEHNNRSRRGRLKRGGGENRSSLEHALLPS